MGDRQKSFKFNSKNGGVIKMQEEMRKNIISKRKQERFNINGDNRPSYNEWDDCWCSFESQVRIIHSTEDIVHHVKSHPCLNENAIYPDGYIQNASEKLKDYIKSAIELLKKQRAIIKHIQYRFSTCSLTADKLPILTNCKKDENNENDMDTSDAKESILGDENDIINIADVFITQGTVECAWKIWLKLVELNDINSSLSEFLIEFVAFVSSLRPSYFNLMHLGASLGAILHIIKLPLSSDSKHITNSLFFLYNIFDQYFQQSNQPLPPNSHSFILLHLIPAVQEKFHGFSSTLTDTHSTSESTIKFFMGVSLICKLAFDCIKETDQKVRLYQDYKPLLLDCVKVMVCEYPFISLNFSATLADYSDHYVDILTQESVYYYLIKTFRDSNLYKNSTRMALNLANKLEVNEFQNFLIKGNFFSNFAESLKFCKSAATRASFNILEVVFKRLPLAFIAVNFIDSGLFAQICEYYFWGSIQDTNNFLRIAPVILSCEQSSRYIDQLLNSDLLAAFFHELNKASDDDISNAICCAYTLLEWSRAAGKLEDFKVKVEQAGVLHALWLPEVTNRDNRELAEKRINILKILHGEFAS